jgi:hypothetical protein
VRWFNGELLARPVWEPSRFGHGIHDLQASMPKLGVAKAIAMKNVILDGHAEGGDCDRNRFPQTGWRWCKIVTSKAKQKRDGMMLIPTSTHPFNSVILSEATVSK